MTTAEAATTLFQEIEDAGQDTPTGVIEAVALLLQTLDDLPEYVSQWAHESNAHLRNYERLDGG